MSSRSVIAWKTNSLPHFSPEKLYDPRFFEDGNVTGFCDGSPTGRCEFVLYDTDRSLVEKPFQLVYDFRDRHRGVFVPISDCQECLTQVIPFLQKKS